MSATINECLNGARFEMEMAMTPRLSAARRLDETVRPHCRRLSSRRISVTRRGAAGGNRKGYTGYEFEPVAGHGMWNIRNRCVISTLMRWSRRDPLTYRDGPNLYNLVLSNPLTHSDPLGSQVVDVVFDAFISIAHGTWLPEPNGTSMFTDFDGTIYFLYREFRSDLRDFGQFDGTNARLFSVGSGDTALIGLWSNNVGARGRNGVGASHMRTRLESSNGEDTGWKYYVRTAPLDIDTVDIRNVSPCESTIHFVASAGYPFVPSILSPNIDYDVTFRFKVVMPNVVTITAEGDHNSFPDYEAYIDNRLVYTYLAPYSGPGLINLNSNIRVFAAAGLTISATTPSWCDCK